MILAESSHPGLQHIPNLVWVLPFAALLLCIAILPLLRKTEHWWHHNRNKLVIAVLLGLVTLAYYHRRGYGTSVHDAFVVKVLHGLGLHTHAHEGHHTSATGMSALAGALGNALMEYIPFMSLLFSLYVISGGIGVKGDIPAHPRTNVIFLAIGGVLASLVGTTGAAMLLIRPLLKTNSERKHVVHTVVFFIFIVSNIGGSLLPIGDPPLFLGYLRGVPFLWTLVLWKEWAFTIVLLLIVYYAWDTFAYRREAKPDITRDERQVERLAVTGKINFLFLAGVVLATGTLAPGRDFVGTSWQPFTFLREIVQLLFVALSLMLTPRGLRRENNFNYVAILEVACLFIGI
ncbi:MAG: sodium:proton antiporter, partial [Phycisphaerae bacterium]